MAEKHITLSQMELNAARTKTEVLALILAALGGVQVGMTITLPANRWNNRVQTIQNEFFMADGEHWFFVCPDATCYMEGSDAGVRADNVTIDGEMTFRCEIPPENDLIMNIIRLEVEV